MKICVAQTRPLKGDVQGNIENHKKLIVLALAGGAEMVIFPELSLTGYEPALARELATHKDDSRFDAFQNISDTNQITIGVGMPLIVETGICIGLILFQPHQTRQTYSKKYLHSDENPFFVSGQNSIGLIGGKANIALAICYELSVSKHSENAHQSGAQIYIASVAKSRNGVDNANKNLSGIAQKYSMTVFMSNCTGLCDNFVGAGQSSVWNNQGSQVAQLNETGEGIIVFNTDTQEIMQEAL